MAKLSWKVKSYGSSDHNGPRLKNFAIYYKFHFPAKPYNQFTSNLKHIGLFTYCDSDEVIGKWQRLNVYMPTSCLQMFML